ncbi:hypothetical protein [Streptomyces djakartensis]|uniref:Uncharacterized protein n=1 Tax=Streptomyces djakartensis TaxID=68193 RepID=A0ABQ2ZNK8_9ACTN|nr:hypothetical protein [Streptomyces djakartensis]GGY19961.1 hypothetical protein GCM10010384_28030 [Streptomyces djakartensis]
MIVVQEVSRAPYATDGTDFQGALKHHRTAALKRFAKRAAVFGPMWLQIFVTRTEYLLPIALMGFFGVLVSPLLLFSALWWGRRCSRVFRTYPMVFRGPVQRISLERNNGFVIRLGGGSSGSPTMAGRNLSGKGWPASGSAGVWYAGDDLFGGVGLVPTSGELLFMQPHDWPLTSAERANAPADRVAKAEQAGIKGYVSLRS